MVFGVYKSRKYPSLPLLPLPIQLSVLYCMQWYELYYLGNSISPRAPGRRDSWKEVLSINFEFF